MIMSDSTDIQRYRNMKSGHDWFHYFVWFHQSSLSSKLDCSSDIPSHKHKTLLTKQFHWRKELLHNQWSKFDLIRSKSDLRMYSYIRASFRWGSREDSKSHVLRDPTQRSRWMSKSTNILCSRMLPNSILASNCRQLETDYQLRREIENSRQCMKFRSRKTQFFDPIGKRLWSKMVMMGKCVQGNLRQDSSLSAMRYIPQYSHRDAGPNSWTGRELLFHTRMLWWKSCRSTAVHFHLLVPHRPYPIHCDRHCDRSLSRCCWELNSFESSWMTLL